MASHFCIETADSFPIQAGLWKKLAANYQAIAEALQKAGYREASAEERAGLVESAGLREAECIEVIVALIEGGPA